MITKKKRVTLRDGRQLFLVEDKDVEPCGKCCFSSGFRLPLCSIECFRLAEKFGFDLFYSYFTK